MPILCVCEKPEWVNVIVSTINHTTCRAFKPFEFFFPNCVPQTPWPAVKFDEKNIMQQIILTFEQDVYDQHRTSKKKTWIQCLNKKPLPNKKKTILFAIRDFTRFCQFWQVKIRLFWICFHRFKTKVRIAFYAASQISWGTFVKKKNFGSRLRFKSSIRSERISETPYRAKSAVTMKGTKRFNHLVKMSKDV